jgi:hypothetical protein
MRHPRRSGSRAAERGGKPSRLEMAQAEDNERRRTARFQAERGEREGIRARRGEERGGEPSRLELAQVWSL